MKPAKLASIIIEKIQSPTATFKGLTSRILNLVNTSYCSSPERISDITKALHYIGISTLIQVVLTNKVVI